MPDRDISDTATESRRHSRDSIAKTAKQLRDGGALRHLTQEQAERRVRRAVLNTSHSES